MEFLNVLYMYIAIHSFRIGVIDSRFCKESRNTWNVVQSCPTSVAEVEERARVKDCESLAKSQNCSTPSRFKYHCVIDAKETHLVEVCAPAYFMLGYCAEYNVHGARIQDHYNRRCTAYSPPCPHRYISTDAYKFTGCYEQVKKHRNLTTPTTLTVDITTSPTNDTPTKNDIFTSAKFWIPFVAGIITCIIIVISAACYFWRRKGPDQENPINKMDYKYNLLLATKNIDEEEEIVELAEENEDITRTYIDSFRSFETYFVETRVFKECKTKLQNKGVAVLVGPPGCGKTSIAIGIMKDAFYKDWIKRKITSWTEFTFIDSKTNSLIYIDNIFDGFMYQHELEKWWDMLNTTFYENISPNENPEKDDDGFVSNTGGKIHLLITTKDSVLPRAREYNIIRKTPVFKKDCIIFTGSFPLTDAEKDDIFDKQSEYAENILDIPKPLVGDEFRRWMKSSECHVGFPLCAHLYACEEGYRQTGVAFFLYPINYLRNQIKSEIDKDATHSVKTLLLLLFLRECLPISKGCEERLNLRDLKKCRDFLVNNLSEKLVEQIELSFSGDLEKVADTLTVMIVRQDVSDYKFKHQIICDAVGFYFCTAWPEAVFGYFPIDAFEKHEFVNPPPELCNSFLSRVVDEVNKGNVSKALACAALKQDTFARRFCEILESKENLKTFFTIPDVASRYSLPAVFWISKYKNMSLSLLLDELIKAKKISVKHNFYLARFGECCANDENFLRKTDKNAFSSTTALQEAVFQYTGDNEISILHLIMMSERHDHNASMITQKLIDDFKSPEICKQIARDPCGQTVVNCAASEKRYSRILCILALYKGRKDPQHKLGSIEYSPIHKALEVVLKCSYSIHLELEMLIRLCLFIIYGVDPKRKTYNGETLRDMYRNINWKNIHSLLCMKNPSQVKMSKLIEKLLTEIDMPHGNALEATITVPNPGTQLSKPLMKVITKYVYHFAKRELPS